MNTIKMEQQDPAFEDVNVSQSKATAVMVIGDENRSLQDSFMKFRNRKLKERQILKMCRGGLGCDQNRSEEYKIQLRSKFIETAKKYMGVPYHIKYKPEGEPAQPLYLDCCGLVRQVLMDLQEEFGFIVGKWNQAYQMDTLPIVLKQEDLKPGDLIFYEGTYYSKTSKPQKHNNVHVEIFLGGETGEATIGARYQRGVIQIFPSFKFKSTSWELVQYHFRSLDTWLSGDCRSYCSEHPWVSDILTNMAAAGKKSIFNDGDDESAGGDDEERNQPEVDESDNKENCEYESGGGDEDDTSNNCGVVGAASSSVAPVGLTSTVSSKHNSSKPKRQSSIRASFSSDSAKCKTETATINPPSSPLKSPTSNISPSRLARTKSTTRREQSASLDSLTAPKKSILPRTYYVCQSNGWKLVKQALDKRGWQQLPFDYNFSSRFDLKWVERKSDIDYKSHQPGQLVCHIPNNDCITTKVNLLHTMREYFAKVQPRPIEAKYPIAVNWLPESYQLDTPADCVAALAANDAQENCIWIYKPVSNNRGRGIRVISGRESLHEICYGKQTGDPETSIPPSKGIVQKYITNPLLIGQEKLKFDVRCYLLVARTEPKVLAFYHPGYCRLTLKSFTMAMEKLGDSSIHLTNAAIQKKDPLYKEMKEKQIQMPEDLALILEADGFSANADFIRNQLDHQIKLCLVDVLKASSPKFLKKHGYFDLLGCDFMVTDDNQLFLIEINTNPALSLDNSTLEKLLPTVVDDTIDIVLKCQGPDKMSNDVASAEAAKESGSCLIGSHLNWSPDNINSKFELIFDEATGFAFGN